jgi:dCMP deaminase
MTSKWDIRFMALAEHVAQWSKDQSTKCAAIITNGKYIVSLGFNGFPAGCNDNADIYKDRERKLSRVLHGEINAILTARRDLTGCTIYVHPFCPCSQCAAAIIQSGIKRVVTRMPSAELKERWGESITESLLMFKEALVKYTEI